MTKGALQSKTSPRAFFLSAYEPDLHRWCWTIVERGVEVARSVATFPTQHDANNAARTLAKHLGVKW